MREAMQVARDHEARPSRGELLALFGAIATEVVEKDFHHVTEPMIVGELGIDSLAVLEIVGSLERRLRIQLPDESLAGMATIEDLLDEVEKRLS